MVSQEVQKTLQSQIKIKESAEIKAEVGKVELWERGGGKSLEKGGGKEGKAAAGGKDGAEGGQPQRRVASAKPNKQSGEKDAARRARTKPNAVKTTRVAKEPATKGPVKEEPLQTNPKQSGGGRGKPPAVAPRPRKHVKRASESSSSRGQSAAEGEEGAPNTGLRRSKRIANRK